MLILTIRTDKPDAEIGLYEDDKQLAYVSWQAHRQLAETLHLQIQQLLLNEGKKLHDVQGIVCFQGPGSFTGLRIGLSVANALAASLPAAIVASQDPEWLAAGLNQLLSGQNHQVALPEYGAPVHITSPKH